MMNPVPWLQMTNMISYQGLVRTFPNEVMLPWSEMNMILHDLDKACCEFDYESVREILLQAPAAFNPTDGICDLLWNKKVS
ncbi:hypothetical protein [Enterobacter roggenkampii]|uniref:hypothetical protein n=1 Tax=Enterobacter roggenkampii TaxID=1812935 RepID=UPI00292C76CE|nr:hypothetical protein [Enterobacter roggenkampii]MDV0478082.1 hypothetical protein [Enterobacter roggenkampii]